MYMKLFAGSLLALGLSFTSLNANVEATKDCCARKLACCASKGACCLADTKLGCCEQGMKCCADNKGCCAAVQKCCTSGSACCNESKACCGVKVKTTCGDAVNKCTNANSSRMVVLHSQRKG